MQLFHYKYFNNLIQPTSYDNKTIATTTNSEKIIKCDDIELLNLVPYPNATYVFNGIEYTTDKLCRVVKVTQPVGKAYKQKCKAKSKIKAKKAVQYLGNENVQTYYQLALPAYQAPEVLINTAFYIQTQENKTAIKNIGKSIKKQTKQKGSAITLITELKYNDASMVPSSIEVCVSNEHFTINNPSAHQPPLSEVMYSSSVYDK